MTELTGKSVCKGIAIGRIRILKKAENLILKRNIEDTDAEVARFESAKEKAIEDLKALYEKSAIAVGGESADIFNVHSMMLEDENYNDSILNIIKTQKVNAEYAVATTGDNFAEMFENMDDEYLKARSADIKDISSRLIGILSGITNDTPLGDEQVILMADEIAPSELVKLDKNKLLAIVTRHGSTISHTAILARAMSIPAVTGLDINGGINGEAATLDEHKDEHTKLDGKKCKPTTLDVFDGKLAIVDGYLGKIILDPSEGLLLEYQQKKNTKDKEAEDKHKELIASLVGKDNVTRSGKKINLLANIGNLSDLGNAIQYDAGGIGLFRSEFLFLEKDKFPTEDEQFATYKQVAESMGSKKVIIRTLDIGADKQADYFDIKKEENPALGYREIRIFHTRPDIFKTQLRALFRASTFGNLSIMYPMIISLDDVLKIKEISKSVKEELISEGIEIGDVKEGIMIETPSAALISDELAKQVDFFSIGTNDLTQHMLDIDRQNAKLDSFYNAHHPELLGLIKLVVDNGHKEGIFTGICGELASDTSLTEEFIKIGIDELSVSPTSILPVRKAIRDAE